MSTIFWFLRSEGAWASSRLQGTVIHEQLVREGYRSQIVYSKSVGGEWPDLWESDEELESLIRPGDILILQKLDGLGAERLVRAAKNRGAWTIYVECDRRPNCQMPALTDFVVCPSSHLRTEIISAFGRDAERVRQINDPIETAAPSPQPGNKKNYRLVWIGNSENWSTLRDTRDVLSEDEFADLALVTISDHPEATCRWTRQTAFANWRNADVCIVPTGTNPESLCKSNNRVTQAMALGLPVICGEIPAYREVIEHGVNGLRFTSAEELRQALRAFRDSEVRVRIARAGWQLATSAFAPEVILERWLAVFRDVAGMTELTPFRATTLSKLSDRIRVRRFKAKLSIARSRAGCSTRSETVRHLLRGFGNWPFERQILVALSKAIRHRYRRTIPRITQ